MSHDITELIDWSEQPDESLMPVPRMDRYCFAPCVDQLQTGVCDCTRRIEREVAEATRRAIESFAKEDTDE